MEPAEPLLPLHVVKRRHVEAVMHACNGNASRAAQALGIDRKTLYRMLRRWANEDVP